MIQLTPMLIGYARVSTQDQKLDLQKDALKKAGCKKIFTDVAGGGALVERPGLKAALEVTREGDTLVVWKLDRLGRSLRHLIESVTEMKERKVGFRSLQESIDTTTSGGKLVFHLFGALADYAEPDVMRTGSAAVWIPPANHRLIGPHNHEPIRDAISASGALNFPRRRPGGRTASTASSFSEGSIRR